MVSKPSEAVSKQGDAVIAQTETEKSYSERAAEIHALSEKNRERLLKTLEEEQQRRGKVQTAAKLRWALGLDDDGSGKK